MSDNHDVVVNVTEATVDVNEDEDAEFGGFEMAEDVPTVAEAQPLPATWLILTGSQQLLQSTELQNAFFQEEISNGIDETNGQIISYATTTATTTTTTTTTTDAMSNLLATPAVSAQQQQQQQQQQHERETTSVDNHVLNRSPRDVTASSVTETSSFPSATAVAPASIDSAATTRVIEPASAAAVPMLSTDVVTAELCRQQLHNVAKYSQLQEQHKVELFEMRRATQETLSVIVQQHQELCSAAIQDCELACKRQMQEFVENEKKILTDTIHAQEEKITQMLEDERVKFSAHLDDCLQQQRLEQQEKYETYLQEERNRFHEELNAAIQEQHVNCQKAIEEATEAERQRTQQLLLEEQENSRQALTEERELARKALQDACQLERIQFKQATDAVVNEQKSRIEAIMTDTLKLARQQITLYVNEQKQDDYSVRLRLTSSIDILLTTARQQLQQLLAPPSEPRQQQQQQQQQLAMPSSDQRLKLITEPSTDSNLPS